jgi:hypothetical protein
VTYELKRVIVGRIISHLNPVPAGAANELLGQSLPDLEVILEKLISTRDQENAEEEALARIQEAQTERAFDTSWGATLARVSLNGRYLCDVESNRSVLESLLNPGETPTPAGYSTLVLQFPTKFSWQTPQPKPTKEDQRKAFEAFVRTNDLSGCEANFQLFRDGASVEHFAGASGIERNQYASEAQAARQHFLRHEASPQQLREEARFQSATEREIAIKAEADRAHQFVSQAQAGLYSPLPATDENGTVIDSRYIKKLSTLDYPRFRAWVKKYGTAQITEVLRTPTAAPAV